jgi:predicted phage baseplate assembly protein
VFTLNTPIAFVGTVSGASVSLVSDGITYNTYPKTTTVTVAVTEGERFTETYTATGLSGQQITLRQSGVVTNSVVVNVGEGSNEADVRYAYSERIIDGNSGSKIFTVDIDADNYTIVSFGNGINGKIPTTNASITIEYRRSRGSAGNVVVGAITTLESTTVLNKPALDGIRVIPNTVVASGGVDIESMASLKANIPASFRTQDRAVSLQDYKDIVKRIPGVVRSTAYVDGSNIVQVLALEEPSDYGSTLTLAITDSKKQEIIDYLDPREIVFASSNVGASVSLTRVHFVASVQVQNGYIQEAVNDNVKNAVRALFSFDNMDFGGRVSLGTVYRTILDIQGVDYAVVTRFTTTSGNVIDSSGGFTGVEAPATSLLTIASSSTFTVTPSGGIIASGG